MDDGDYTKIDSTKVDALLSVLFLTTAGPAEAYGTLIAALYKLNFEFLEHPSTMDGLIGDISKSLQSIKPYGRAN